MSDLKARLDEIDIRAGRMPTPDPGIIQGEPGPMPPPIRELEPGPIPEPDWLDEDPDAVPEPDEPSPLIPRQTAREFLGAQGPPGQPQAPPSIGEPDLAVIVVGDQRGASYKGKDVALTEAEMLAIARIVHKALGRAWRESGKALAAPRRTRLQRQLDTAVAAQSKAEPKRRGRPKKQRLDGTES